MKKGFILLFLILYASLFAQEKEYQSFTAYYLGHLGVSYQNNFYLEPGADIYLVTPKDNVLDIGATANLTYADDTFVVIPEASIAYLFNKKGSKTDPYSYNFNSAFYVLRANISPYHFTPEVGITLLSLLELSAGYGFEFNKHNHVDLDGLKIALSLRIPFSYFSN